MSSRSEDLSDAGGAEESRPLPIRKIDWRSHAEGLALQEQTRILDTAAVKLDVVGAIAGGTPHQIIVCHLVRHGDLRLMKNRHGNMMVKWDTFRP